MKIKIVSDGTGNGTKVVNADTNEPIENIARLRWVVSATGWAKAQIHFYAVPLEAVGETDMELTE